MNENTKKGKAWRKREIKPFKAKILFLTLLTVVSTLLSLAFSFLVRYVINSAADGDKGLLIVFSAVLLCIIFSRVCISTFRSYLSEKYKAQITVGLRNRLFYGVLRSDYKKAESYHSGDILNRLTTDVNEVASDSVNILPAVAGMVAQCIGAITALLMLDPLFTAIFTVGGILIGGLTALFRRKIKRYHKLLTEADGKSRSFMQEGISSLLTVKAYGVEKRSEEKSGEILNEYYEKRMKRNTVNALLSGGFSLLGNAGMIFAVIWCSVSVMTKGNSDYGSILSVVMLLSQLQQPFTSFSAILPVCYARDASAERLAETDCIEREELGVPVSEYGKIQSLEVENLSFAYDDREPVFENATAHIGKGQIVCVTGASGSGKSTLFKLLLCVYRPTSGQITVRTESGDEVLSPSHRGLFAYVPQGNFLFSGTVYENLTFFTGVKQSKETDEKIRRALIVACAEFVYELPDGLNTSLKERGGGLSEGQLQRLAIARAILSERPVLLLDEATSALDEETERKVLENIRAEKNKTCLIVTHRPAALKIADGVCKVEKKKTEEYALSQTEITEEKEDTES